MAAANPFKGIIPPVSTIFNKNGKLDQAGMSLLINDLISRGVHGLFFLGTGGEFSQLTIEERKEVAEFAVKEVNGRVPVLIGTGGLNTKSVIELNKHAKAIQADGVVVVNPYYLKLSEENLYRHYSEIAEHTELPILLYNFPALTGQNLSAGLVLRLVNQYNHIVGIKETVEKIGHIREIILKVKSGNPEFRVLCGYEDLFLDTLTFGGDGIIGAGSNFAPELSIDLYDAFLRGDYQRAVELNKRLAMIPEMYKLDTPFINVIKEAIAMSGLNISTEVLPPVRPLDEEKKKELENILKQAEILAKNV
ncbi:4-hydroxy-tetrahydrodipicolinate synthase [Bacillus sp. FJAT-27251]|uniref:4-hydroxy-tetrahydrodipicolinate synthase n=1 Tax=Bacillus sp. FJAT-27251 TaxID=1684142 RepID=UPI0006A7C354|nr:4-hydroxy-tetrahydrodipicolinate synthase [Bacillus sp. FJAT-27251]